MLRSSKPQVVFLPPSPYRAMAMAGCSWPLDDTGPDKVEALLEFPLQAWHDLQRAEHHGILLPGAVDQALRHLRDGIFGFSSYTGIAAWELGAFYTEQAAELLGLMGTSGSAGGPLALQMVEAWDLKATAQEVILDMDARHQPKHLFSDINMKCTKSAKGVLDNLVVPDCASKAEKARALAAMKVSLKDMEENNLLFSANSFRDCLRCQKQCRLWDIPPGQERNLTIGFAGMTCKDVSNMNRRRQSLLGPSGRPLLVYLAELRFRRPIVVLTECTVAQDVAFLEDTLGDMYAVHTLLLSPCQLGWWADRRRRFCILVLLDGPVHFDSSCIDKFLQVFGKQRPEKCSRGDMFLAASRKDVRAHFEADQDKLKQSAGRTATSWVDLLEAAQATRLLLAKRKVLTEVCSVDEEDLANLTLAETTKLYHTMAADKHIFCNLLQGPGHMLTTSGAVPCLLSKFNMFSLTKSRPMLPLEALLVQGIDLLGLSTFRPPWGSAFQLLPNRAQEDLIGNSINVHCTTCLYLFTLANLRPRRAALLPLPRVLKRVSSSASQASHLSQANTEPEHEDEAEAESLDSLARVADPTGAAKRHRCTNHVAGETETSSGKHK